MEEARAEFRTKIAAAINEAKSCKSGANRDEEDIQREKEYTAVEMEGRLNSLLGSWKLGRAWGRTRGRGAIPGTGTS